MAEDDQNASSSDRHVPAGSRRGAVLLLGTAAGALTVTWFGQQWIQQWYRANTASSTTESRQLWKRYRWSIDPQQRRDAALRMAARERDDATGMARLLAGQGWGNAPLAAISLELAAETATDLGRQKQATDLWRSLLKRFPESASSAWARRRLGASEPDLLIELLERQPRHPAALSAAEAVDPEQTKGHQGALHLARWGVTWPGAAGRLRDACEDQGQWAPDDKARQHLARGLAQLGDADAAEDCLPEGASDPETALAIGRTLLRGNREQGSRGERLLLNLTREHPRHPTSLEAAKLLSDPLVPKAEILNALPSTLAQSSPAVAAGRVRLEQGREADQVIEQWPDDPAIWQLQWDLSRDALLAGQWERANTLLTKLSSGTLPQPLEARRLFWLGFSADRLGKTTNARSHWQELIEQQPAGYYSWLAERRLHQTPLPNLQRPDLAWAESSQPAEGAADPDPLNSGDDLVNQLWDLGLMDKAWEQWLTRSETGQEPSYPDQLVEGRLRIAVGDPWMGLDQLFRVSLRWRHPNCEEAKRLQRNQSPRLFSPLFQSAARDKNVSSNLLYGISKQESRFTPDVRSVVGAAGLMQLMPATAAELAGRPLEAQELDDPELNITLGAAYLKQLLEQWQGHPLLAIASYNAGPGTVEGWRNDELDTAPELWVERIPYPETRYYTKKVMDNLLRYADLSSGVCEQNGAG